MKMPIRLLHIEERFHPEMGYQVNFLARFHSKEFEVIILTSGSMSLWNDSLSEPLEDLDRRFEQEHNVKIIRQEALFDRKGKRNLWIRGLLRTVWELEPDILFVHGVETFSFLRILLSVRLPEKILVVTDTHTLLNQIRQGIKQRAHQELMRRLVSRRIAKRKVRVFYTTTENRAILKDIYHVEDDLILPLLIGTDPEVYFYDKDSGDALRNELSILSGETVILYTGKFNMAKGPHLILQALGLLQSRLNTKVCAVFVGSGRSEYVQEYLSHEPQDPLVRSLIIDSVNYTGLYRYYSMADVAVFPKENTLSALDAQACRLPLVMENDMTNADRLKMGGMLYEPGNIDDLAEKILYLVQRKDLREELGKAGQEYIGTEYDYRKIVSRFEKELKGLLKDPEINQR